MARPRPPTGITSLNFNQDQGCFTCCLNAGIRGYNTEPLVELYQCGKKIVGDVTICEMVFRSNFVLIVRADAPSRLVVYDAINRKEIMEVTFYSPIRAVKARKDKVAVVLPTAIQVLSVPSYERVALVLTRETARPLCALATDPGVPQILAAPAHRVGSVQLLDITHAVTDTQSSSPAVISCHVTDVVCLCMSQNGAKLATASERGTLIRVWDTGSRTLINEVRRGADYANIYSINFNAATSLIACVSDKGTLHIWSFKGKECVHIAQTTVARTAGRRSHCALQDNDTAYVICEDGTFHKYNFSAEGTVTQSEFDYFLEIGDDEDFYSQ